MSGAELTNVGETPLKDLMTIADIAAAHGLKPSTIGQYHRDAQRRRQQGCPKPGDMPPPTTRIGRSPVWAKQTHDQWWYHQRPGQGAGGGRPVGYRPSTQTATARSRP